MKYFLRTTSFIFILFSFNTMVHADTAVVIPAPVYGQVNSGVQSVNPVNNTATVTTTTAPVMNSATASCNAIAFKTLLDIAIWVKCIIGAVIIPGIFSLAFVVFLWGVFKFIRSSEVKDKQESKQFIYMGLIGLFVMVSVWGIIKIAATTLGVDSSVVPALQTSDPLSTSNASQK
jgi:hypothetical protein